MPILLIRTERETLAFDDEETINGVKIVTFQSQYPIEVSETRFATMTAKNVGRIDKEKNLLVVNEKELKELGGKITKNF